MNKQKLIMAALMLICITGFGCMFATYGMADHRDRDKNRFEHEDRYRNPFAKSDNEGNETAGQIAAWLLLVANMPIVLSLLVKATTKFAPLGVEVKEDLKRFNRFQKKHLMRLHYYVNLLVLAIVTWHWATSCCRSSVLPELGFIAMAIVISFGALIKFKLCPEQLRKSIYKIHTQPIIFLSQIMIVTIGHLIVD
jgi:hypothetical protein